MKVDCIGRDGNEAPVESEKRFSKVCDSLAPPHAQPIQKTASRAVLRASCRKFLPWCDGVNDALDPIQSEKTMQPVNQ
jgi:recombinational DNA repair protein RecT